MMLLHLIIGLQVCLYVINVINYNQFPERKYIKAKNNNIYITKSNFKTSKFLNHFKLSLNF